MGVLQAPQEKASVDDRLTRLLVCDDSSLHQRVHSMFKPDDVTSEQDKVDRDADDSTA